MYIERGGGARRGATAAVGPGGGRGGEDRLGLGHIRILYKAPEDYTEPQHVIQSHKMLQKYVNRI